ncbi:Uncharacterised protein [Segatella copri]|nr:Uncharacterised protein [Segatella copri]
MAAAGPCDTYWVSPSRVVTSIFPSNPMGVPCVIRIKPTTKDNGRRIRVQLSTKNFQKLPIVCVVFSPKAFIIPAMAAIPVAAVRNWNSIITKS